MIGVGIVGYGYWGPKLVRNFTQTAGCGPVGVCEENPARRARAGRDYQGLTLYARFEELLEQPHMQAVVLATPVTTHYPLARRALEAGKHVLVEKPLTTNGQEARDLVALAERRGLTLMVDHTFVYHPAVRKIGALIRNGDIGKLHYIDSTRINLGLFQHDVNVLWDLAVHDLSIINWFTDERPATVQAIGASHTPNAIENVGFLTLRYASGFYVHINCSWISPVKIRHMLISGDKKMIVYDDINVTEPVKIYDSGFLAKTDEERDRMYVEYRVGDVTSPRIPSREALADVTADFIQAIGGGVKPASDGRFGADIVHVLEAAQHSIAHHGQEVAIP